MVPIRQQLPRPRLAEPAAAAERLVLGLADVISPGMQVAVTVGSRGIAGIADLVGAVVRALRRLGAEPFLVSAMGSHGGGTVAGQAEVLRHLGITADAIGAPLRITDQAVAIGETAAGHTLWCDAEAARADGILVMNRIKPHTAFHGPLASGLFKMMTVGLGKVPGATQVHKLGFAAIYPAIREMGRLALARLPILGGLAIVENGYEETALLELLRPGEMEGGEERLLAHARSLLPQLPVPELDLLIVDEMGKNYSGTGMDTNVIGRWLVPGLPEPERPRIGRIVVLGLSPESGGNANGIGLADFVTRRLANAVDWPATYLNVKTTGFWARAFCPVVQETDRAAIELALESLRLPPGQPVRAARIRNTLHLNELWVTPNLLPELAGQPVEVAGEPAPLRFDPDGRLLL